MKCVKTPACGGPCATVHFDRS